MSEYDVQYVYFRDDAQYVFYKEANLMPKCFSRSKEVDSADNEDVESDVDDVDAEKHLDEELNVNKRSTILQNIDTNEAKKFIINNKRSISQVRNQEVKLSWLRTYINRYKNFIKSPRVHFINEAIFNILFLMLFSYVMLCEFNYYEMSSSENRYSENSTNLTTLSSDGGSVGGSVGGDDDVKISLIRKVKSPTIYEYVLIYWVIAFVVEEARQVWRNFIFRVEVSLNKEIYFDYVDFFI